MFLKIFPEARQYLVDHKINRDFALAELSLKINKPAYQLFGLEKLFALLSNDVLSKEIEDLLATFLANVKPGILKNNRILEDELRKVVRKHCTRKYKKYPMIVPTIFVQ